MMDDTVWLKARDTGQLSALVACVCKENKAIGWHEQWSFISMLELENEMFMSRNLAPFCMNVDKLFVEISTEIGEGLLKTRRISMSIMTTTSA